MNNRSLSLAKAKLKHKLMFLTRLLDFKLDFELNCELLNLIPASCVCFCFLTDHLKIFLCYSGVQIRSPVSNIKMPLNYKFLSKENTQNVNKILRPEVSSQFSTLFTLILFTDAQVYPRTPFSK